MPRGHRSGRLAVGAAASLLLAGCSSRYTDSAPPTGEGQERALLLLVLLVVPTLVLGVVLVLFHLRSRRSRSRDGASPPRTVWIAVLWCLAVAFAAAWPGAIAVGLLVVAAGGPADRATSWSSSTGP